MANTAVTAWGRPSISTGAAGTGGTLGATLRDVGKIKEDTAVLELQSDGSPMELWGEGHELLDRMPREGTWRLFFTIYRADLAKLAELFGLTLSGNELPMGTTVVQEPRSYVVDPLLVGAIGAKLPNCSTTITPKWVANEGWAVDVEATTLVPEDASTPPATLYVKQAPVNEG